MKKTLILSFAILTACSTTKNKQTKSEKSQTKTEIVSTENSTIKTDAQTNTKTTTEIVTDTQTNEVTETTTIEPIDATKPATFTNESGAVVNLNNSKVVKTKKTRLNTDKSKRNVVDDKTEIIAQIEENEGKTEYKSETANTKKESDKVVEQTSLFVQYWWLWVLILLLVVLGIRYRKLLFKN